jgi:hypothetical protein
MRYALVVNNKIKEGPKNLPKSWENISGFDLINDQQLKEFGWLPWVFIETTIQPDQVYDTPIITIEADRIVETQTVRDKTPEELAEELKQKQDSIRGERNQLLQDTDWVIIKSIEAGVSNLAQWKAYRQALRDITAQPGFPNNVTWPTKPE